MTKEVKDDDTALIPCCEIGFVQSS